jgi:hypothetical protein
MVAMIDMGLRNYPDKQALPFFLSLSTLLINPTSEGLPTRSDSDSLNALEDAVEAQLRSGGRFVYVGRVTWNGHRELLYYLDNQQPCVDALRNHYLGARRVTYQVQVSGGGFVLAQVDINGHMAPVIRWGRAHEDRRAAGNFSDEPGEANPRREGRERWNLSFQNLLRAGVRPGRAVADVARGFHDVLTNAVGRFPYRNLILFRTGYIRQLFEVGDEGVNFCLAHGWRQHVLPPNVEPLQQHNLGFLSHGGYV